jgi:hypothetical protein
LSIDVNEGNQTRRTVFIADETPGATQLIDAVTTTPTTTLNHNNSN